MAPPLEAEALARTASLDLGIPRLAEALGFERAVCATLTTARRASSRSPPSRGATGSS
jgi:hypothetical protein